MALRVICPNNCRLQVPDSRAGTIVRCPKCQQPIKIADLSTAKPIEREDGIKTVDASVPSREELAKLKQRQVKQLKKRKKVVSKRELAVSASSVSPSSTTADLPETTEHKLSDAIDLPTNPAKSNDGRWLVDPDPALQSKSDSESSTPSKSNPRADNTKTNSVPPALPGKKTEKPDAENVETKAATESGQESETKERVAGVTHSKDARSHSTFLAFGLFLVGVFAIIPAVSEFVQYANMQGTTGIHRWAAWLVFLGALNIFYSVYVAQLADWTSIWFVSLLMIGISVVMATLLAGLALSNAQNSLIANQFEIPGSLKLKAEIWLLTMLSITSLIAYLSGREATRWKKIEKNLQSIAMNSNN